MIIRRQFIPRAKARGLLAYGVIRRAVLHVRAALFFVSVFGIGRLAVLRKCPDFRRSLVLVDVRKSLHGGLENQLLLMEESCTLPCLSTLALRFLWCSWIGRML